MTVFKERRRSLSSTPENNEDAGEKGDDSWNKAEVESKHGNQANENQIDRQQKHSDIFVKAHGIMICRSCPMSRTKIMEQSRSGCFPAADLHNGGLATAAPCYSIFFASSLS
jgi:hypothetical protein